MVSCIVGINNMKKSLTVVRKIDNVHWFISLLNNNLVGTEGLKDAM